MFDGRLPCGYLDQQTKISYSIPVFVNHLQDIERKARSLSPIPGLAWKIKMKTW